MMEFHRTSLPGVLRIQLDPHEDDRGYLVRTYCEREFLAQNLNTHWPQCNLTRTLRRGTIRGLHYQASPCPEIKLVSCIKGKILDVVVDVQPKSQTFGKWEAFELSEETHVQLYIPAGFAHGFQCLSDNCKLYYQMSDFFSPELSRGVRWDDFTLNIPWPIASGELSERDRNLPALTSL